MPATTEGATSWARTGPASTEKASAARQTRAVRNRLDFGQNTLSRLGAFGSPCRRWVREHHGFVADRAEAQAQKIERVVLVELPRPLGTLLGLVRQRALDIAGREGDPRLLLQGGIDVARRALAQAGTVHAIEQAADILAHQVGLQRPRGVGVAEHRRKIR